MKDSFKALFGLRTLKTMKKLWFYTIGKQNVLKNIVFTLSAKKVFKNVRFTLSAQTSVKKHWLYRSGHRKWLITLVWGIRPRQLVRKLWFYKKTRSGPPGHQDSATDSKSGAPILVWRSYEEPYSLTTCLDLGHLGNKPRKITSQKAESRHCFRHI